MLHENFSKLCRVYTLHVRQLSNYTFRDVSNLFLDVTHHLCVFQSITE